MRRSYLLAVSVLAAACEQDFSISGDPNLDGLAEAPSLATPVIFDRIVQTPEAAADILFVVDNSPTMDDDWANLFRNLPVMMDFFVESELNFRVGVTSTNKKRNGKLFWSDGEMFITPRSADPVGTFVDMCNQIPRSPGAPENEAGIATTYMALELNQENAGFLRPDAGLHVIVLTDEDEQSGGNPITRNEFINWMNSFPQDPESVTYSSIVCFSGDSCVSGGGTVGNNYMAVTDAVGGVKWPINDNDYTDALELLAVQAAGLRHEFYLTQVPVPGTVAVSVEDESGHRDGVNVDDIPEGKTAQDVCKRRDDCENGFPFSYDPARNSVNFNAYVPDPFADITITYELLAEQNDELEAADSDE